MIRIEQFAIDPTEFMETGFVADCPCCHQWRRWYFDDFGESRTGRRFSLEFRQRFCQAIAEGLVLRVSEGCTYMGSEAGDNSGIRIHRFKSNGVISRVCLPASSVIHVLSGQALQKGEDWCTAMPLVPGWWKGQSVANRWSTISLIVNRTHHIGMLQQAWFDAETFSSNLHGNLVFVPADLATPAVGCLEPTAIIWEMSRCEESIDPAAQAVIFPPAAMSKWFDLDQPLGGIRIDANIGDPRYQPNSLKPSRPSVELPILAA